MRKFFATLFLGLVAVPEGAAMAPLQEAMPLGGPMVADISQSNIQIHSGFNGTELLIFGARNVGGDLVIAVRGPAADVALRRKERIAGMWMHVEQHKYDQLPLFYAVASTRPLRRITSSYMLHQLGLGERQAIARSNLSGNLLFDRALQNYLNEHGRWQEPFSNISYFGESLFKARLQLPANLPRGDYTVEAYLFDRGELIAFQTIPLRAFKTGSDAQIYDAARRHPFLYGLSAILMALAGGWLAHRLFHRF